MTGDHKDENMSETSNSNAEEIKCQPKFPKETMDALESGRRMINSSRAFCEELDRIQAQYPIFKRKYFDTQAEIEKIMARGVKRQKTIPEPYDPDPDPERAKLYEIRWDREAFQRRLRTFSELYVTTTRAFDAMEAAMHGYFDTHHTCGKRGTTCLLLCEMCGNEAYVVDLTGYNPNLPKYQEAVRLHRDGLYRCHDERCIFKTTECDESAYRFHFRIKEDAIDYIRAERNKTRDCEGSLPVVVHPLDEEQMDHLDFIIYALEAENKFKFPMKRNKSAATRTSYLLPYFGWNYLTEGDEQALQCDLCYRRVNIHDYKSLADNEDSKLPVFDVVKEHRNFCPWVNAEHAHVRPIRFIPERGKICGYEWMMEAMAEERTFQFGFILSSYPFQASRLEFIADMYRSMARARQQFGLPPVEYPYIGTLEKPKLDLPPELFEGLVTWRDNGKGKAKAPASDNGEISKELPQAVQEDASTSSVESVESPAKPDVSEPDGRERPNVFEYATKTAVATSSSAGEQDRQITDLATVTSQKNTTDAKQQGEPSLSIPLIKTTTTEEEVWTAEEMSRAQVTRTVSQEGVVSETAQRREDIGVDELQDKSSSLGKRKQVPSQVTDEIGEKTTEASVVGVSDLTARPSPAITSYLQIMGQRHKKRSDNEAIAESSTTTATLNIQEHQTIDRDSSSIVPMNTDILEAMDTLQPVDSSMGDIMETSGEITAVASEYDHENIAITTTTHQQQPDESYAMDVDTSAMQEIKEQYLGEEMTTIQQLEQETTIPAATETEAIDNTEVTDYLSTAPVIDETTAFSVEKKNTLTITTGMGDETEDIVDISENKENLEYLQDGHSDVQEQYMETTEAISVSDQVHESSQTQDQRYEEVVFGEQQETREAVSTSDQEHEPSQTQVEQSGEVVTFTEQQETKEATCTSDQERESSETQDEQYAAEVAYTERQDETELEKTAEAREPSFPEETPVEIAEELDILGQQHHQLDVSEEDQIISDEHQQEHPATDSVGSPFVEAYIEQEITIDEQGHRLEEGDGSEKAARDIGSEIAQDDAETINVEEGATDSSPSEQEITTHEQEHRLDEGGENEKAAPDVRSEIAQEDAEIINVEDAADNSPIEQEITTHEQEYRLEEGGESAEAAREIRTEIAPDDAENINVKGATDKLPNSESVADQVDLTVEDEEIPAETPNLDEESEQTYEYEESPQSETDRQIAQLEEEDIGTDVQNSELAAGENDMVDLTIDEQTDHEEPSSYEEQQQELERFEDDREINPM